ncbi:MAG: ribosome biogenesis GTPase Der [Solibacterales bacterium]|nr:ribosome biogenesis GTPase Der [Bryobacterales bacterium]|tara:strand:- start:3055 stop:4386 length:1332 start_codon:yes stop_codon:yes gene_type:complete
MNEALLPTLVIVGRPNVGKSTLFNRITVSRRSIVSNQPGMTRDRIYFKTQWRGRSFELTDTGGMLFGETSEFPKLISEQVLSAVEMASHLIFVVDGRSELSATDHELARMLRRTGKPVSLAVNKCDTTEWDSLASQFYELGIESVFAISAEHNRGINDLLDHATAEFLTAENVELIEQPIQVAIIGRPNVGKSTLLNRLSGVERAIVSPTPGTTRDAVDEVVEHEGVTFRFVDTAGIRRKGKTEAGAEKLSVVMAQRHIRLANVVIVLVDANEGVVALDAKIASYAHDAGKALVVIVNKWDQAPPARSKRAAISDFTEKVRHAMKFLDYAPILFISALNGQGTGGIFKIIQKVYETANLRITTGELNRFLSTVDFDRTTFPGFRKPTIRYVTQASTAPPTFVFFTSGSKKFHFSYERFLVNQLRAAFDFEGTPLVIKSKRVKR